MSTPLTHTNCEQPLAVNIVPFPNLRQNLYQPFLPASQLGSVIESINLNGIFGIAAQKIYRIVLYHAVLVFN